MTETPTTFRVAYKTATRMIVGLEPSGPVGANSAVATLDMTEYANVAKFDPAYLSADGEHVLGEPPA